MNIPNDISKTEIVVAMQEWILGQNAERNREILARRLFDGITFEQLAEEFELSDRQVKNIVYKCSNIVFKHIRR